MTRRFLPLLLVLAACVHYPNQWVDSRVPSPSEPLMYQVLHMSLNKAGYPIGIGADKGERTIRTGWATSLAPFKGDGFRQRVHVEYTPRTEGGYAVRLRVERQTNESLRPLDPRFVKWKDAPDNVEEARRILQIVRSYQPEDLEIGPAPRGGRREGEGRPR